jgi:hypothetical protein
VDVEGKRSTNSGGASKQQTLQEASDIGKKVDFHYFRSFVVVIWDVTTKL